MAYNFSFSYSRWSVWKKCPFAYKLKHIDKMETPTSEALIKGRKVHNDIEKYLMGAADEQPAALKHYSQLGEQLREARAASPKMVFVEQQYAVDDTMRPVTWFSKNAKWRFAWDVLVDNGTHADGVDWKGLALDTPMRTPAGLKTMGTINVGDEVFSNDGTPTRVVGKSEVKHLRCFEVSFDTGADPIICDEEHLWEIIGRGVVRVTDLKSQDKIALPSPCVAGTASYPIDPYVLGCWLGDGHARDGMISKPDDEMFDNIEARGYSVLPAQVSSSSNGRTVTCLRGVLSQCGLLNNKHVPKVVHGMPLRYRQDLIRGLMDTDGTYNRARKRAEFTSVQQHISESVQQVLASCGERATIMAVQRHGFGKDVIAYEVHWTPLTFNPFLLRRKAARVEVGREKAWRFVRVKGVREVDSVPTQCISVAHPSQMYLAGAHYIPTHNTGKPYGSYDDQKQLFGMAAFWRNPKLETFTGHWLYLDHKDEPPHTVTYNRDQAGQLTEVWKANAAMMAADQAFVAKPSDSACRFCDFHWRKGGPCKDGV